MDPGRGGSFLPAWLGSQWMSELVVCFLQKGYPVVEWVRLMHECYYIFFM